MLHAKEITIKHPSTNQRLKIEAPIPEYIKEILKKLRG